MSLRFFAVPWMAAACALTGCAAPLSSGNLVSGPGAYDAFSASAAEAPVGDYRIGPLDAIDISVFREPDLQFKEVQVDAAGNIALPLIGTVKAVGLTVGELSHQLEALWGQNYLRNPEVTVSVVSSVSQKVIVQGEVTEPGVFDIKGPTTLLEAISRAKGETRVAAMREVAVLRTIGGQRRGVIFDAAKIRRGEMPDPQVQGRDIIIVGYSNARGIWQDILQAAPLFNVLAPWR